MKNSTVLSRRGLAAAIPGDVCGQRAARDWRLNVRARSIFGYAGCALASQRREARNDHTLASSKGHISSSSSANIVAEGRRGIGGLQTLTDLWCCISTYELALARVASTC
jgi:hypothetical protein